MTRRAQAVLARGRAAVSVNDPNICQIYEIGEDAASSSLRWTCSRAKSLYRSPAPWPTQRGQAMVDWPRHAAALSAPDDVASFTVI